MRYFIATAEMIFVGIIMMIVGTAARLMGIFQLIVTDPLMMLALIAWLAGRAW